MVVVMVMITELIDICMGFKDWAGGMTGRGGREREESSREGLFT